MSRVTIDLKKHAKDHIHYDSSRHVVGGDEEGPYCYQLSHIRFRDIITGGNGMPRPPRTPHGSVERRNLGNPDLVADPGAVFVARGVAVNEFRNFMEDPYHD
jgi:hypothetical protein